MAYTPQFCPGSTTVAQNRRDHMNPDVQLEKLREIPDDEIVKVMGHRQPGEDYKTVHPPLEEMDMPEDFVRDIVEPMSGAKEGHRIRYIQFADSMYNAPAQPYDRARTYMWRFRGVDTGTLSGRQVIEMRESNLEEMSKNFCIDTAFFDPATCGMRGATVHGHSLRLDENGLMFDALQRYVFDEKTGHVLYVKDQVGRPLDEPVDFGEPLSTEKLKEITTIYRKDSIAMRDDEEIVTVVKRIHRARTLGGYMPTEKIFEGL
ncbi:coenzyme-B sulfoethylthiotransferase subunit gamma [Methanococcus aeolicus]|jgi:methyl-coenzyme M reductase gamma subunit|uniref:Methyl-coenzyme M reductase subunit gamma n=1 Tax=Methanococcus aeolicus (strain ATCC BAA-1280 / DSM 17508 / OCM 812 / Nankai-3) TaxID=419665 RepID=A6UWH1_META3|nr:coenzyme-B sulfoethylthiotransferase subunit gamma [Methanococcus aeolicus]ABR56843.1 Methyl-coenzyme M reductase, gamma subunit [Methanococcus aeolicus Nankai-3]UXM84844.1 coenzyme-B sulfoethylthiotransferase subunit gamma [Methanococcus aeolicus]